MENLLIQYISSYFVKPNHGLFFESKRQVTHMTYLNGYGRIRGVTINLDPTKGVNSHMDRFALTLGIIGALNWGSIGLFRYDLVAAIFGGQTATISRIVYTLIALAGVWCISLLFRERTRMIED